jgi:hypothetical protein
MLTGEFDKALPFVGKLVELRVAAYEILAAQAKDEKQRTEYLQKAEADFAWARELGGKQQLGRLEWRGLRRFVRIVPLSKWFVHKGLMPKLARRAPDESGFAGVCPVADCPDEPDYAGVCPAAGCPGEPGLAGVCPVADCPEPGFAGVCPVTGCPDEPGYAGVWRAAPMNRLCRGLPCGGPPR